jgi:hypothetical protein
VPVKVSRALTGYPVPSVGLNLVSQEWEAEVLNVSAARPLKRTD